MSFIDKYYKKFNDSVGEHSLIVSRIEFANLLGVFSKQEQQLDQLKAELEQYKKSKQASYEALQKRCNELELENRKLEADLATLDAVIETCKVQYKTLKQTLTEIKEIANSDNHYFSDGTILRYEVVNKILQKISDCEVQNENN